MRGWNDELVCSLVSTTTHFYTYLDTSYPRKKAVRVSVSLRPPVYLRGTPQGNDEMTWEHIEWIPMKQFLLCDSILYAPMESLHSPVAFISLLSIIITDSIRLIFRETAEVVYGSLGTSSMLQSEFR